MRSDFKRQRERMILLICSSHGRTWARYTLQGLPDSDRPLVRIIDRQEAMQGLHSNDLRYLIQPNLESAPLWRERAESIGAKPL